MTDFYEDPQYHGRPLLIPIDRLPDGKSKVLGLNCEYTITGKGGKLVEINGVQYLHVKRWDIK